MLHLTYMFTVFTSAWFLNGRKSILILFMQEALADDTNSKQGIINEVNDTKHQSESPSPTTLTKYSLEESPQNADESPVSPLATEKMIPTDVSRNSSSPSNSPPSVKAKSKYKDKPSHKRRRSKSSSSSPVRNHQRGKSPKTKKSHQKSPKHKRSRSPSKKKVKLDKSSFSPYSVKSRSPKRSKKKSHSRSPKEKHKKSGKH